MKKWIIFTLLFALVLPVSLNASFEESVELLKGEYQRSGYDTFIEDEWFGVCHDGFDNGEACRESPKTLYSHHHMHIYRIDYTGDLNIERLKNLTNSTEHYFELGWNNNITWKLPNGLLYSIGELKSGELEVNLIYWNLYFNSWLGDRETVKEMIKIFLSSMNSHDFSVENMRVPDLPGWDIVRVGREMFLFNSVTGITVVKRTEDDPDLVETTEDLELFFTDLLTAVGEEEDPELVEAPDDLELLLTGLIDSVTGEVLLISDIKVRMSYVNERYKYYFYKNGGSWSLYSPYELTDKYLEGIIEELNGLN